MYCLLLLKLLLKLYYTRDIKGNGSSVVAVAVARQVEIKAMSCFFRPLYAFQSQLIVHEKARIILGSNDKRMAYAAVTS